MDQALEQYREAAKTAPDNKSIRDSLVMAYLQAGRPVDALNEVKAMVPKWPKDPALRNTLGALYGRNGDSTRALQEFQEALKLDPNFAPAYLNMGDNYLALNDRPKALENYVKAAQISPTLAEASWKAGDLYLADRKVDEAIAAYRRSLLANPNALIPTINLARIYTEERPDLKQALNLAQRAEKLAPADWYVNDVLGWVQFQMGKTDEAVRLLEKATRTEPKAARPRYHLGMAYLKQGKKAAAGAELRQAVALGPNLPQRAEIDKLLDELPR
jgi:tetratricopeptide (TPR) repeat protein